MTAEPQLSLEAACVAKGMRMTEQRRVIARVLESSDDHPDVEELYRRAFAVDPKISISTVYRTVKLFEDAGMIERHEFGDGRSRYETAPEEHHDHLIDLRSVTSSSSATKNRESCRNRSRESSATRSSITSSTLYPVPLDKSAERLA